MNGFIYNPEQENFLNYQNFKEPIPCYLVLFYEDTKPYKTTQGVSITFWAI